MFFRRIRRQWFYFRLSSSLIFVNIENALNILNDIISKCNINLEQKKEAPFSPFGLSDIGLDDAYHLLSASIQSLKIKIQNYNQSISNITNIQSQLNKLNDEIAFYEINQDYTLYLQKKSSMKTADNKVKSAENEIGSTMALENFILGFRLGVRMILEALDEDDGSLIDPNKEG